MIPPFQEYLFPLLTVMGDGKTRTLNDVLPLIGKILALSNEDMSITLEKSGMNQHNDRCSWAKTYLVKAGLLESPARAKFVITNKGRELLKSGIETLSVKYLKKHYPSFAEFSKSKKKKNTSEKLNKEESITPLQKIEEAFTELNTKLGEDLLLAIMEQSPKFFEELVVKLLVSMGYGGDFEDSGEVTKLTGDGGIDGIIKEDALGLDKIYIQAKRWIDTPVGAPAIHEFKGALDTNHATKGVFITTSRFTNEAIAVARNGSVKIILIDGEQLVSLMIKYGVGVVTSHSYDIKRIDVGFFKPE